MKFHKILFIFVLFSSTLSFAKIQLPYPEVKDGIVTYPAFDKYESFSEPCPKYYTDCDDPKWYNVDISNHDVDIRCEKERCPNRLFISIPGVKGNSYYRSFLKCPVETPLMDIRGKCYACNTTEKLELGENYDLPCPERRTFYKKTSENSDKKRLLLPNCSNDRPLLTTNFSENGRCIDCNDTEYAPVLSKIDCDVCPNRTYLNGLCIMGTKDKPIVSDFGKEYLACDTDKDIYMMKENWCSIICPNRFQLLVHSFPNADYYCVKRTISNYIRSFWEGNFLWLIGLTFIGIFSIPFIIHKFLKRKIVK